MLDTEVIVCGGGPAGLAAAIACRMRGLSVTVLEHRQPPIDKPCGEGLLPEAICALGELGVGLGRLPGAPFRGIRFVEEGAADLDGVFRNGPARGVRRKALHEALIARAEQAGVDLRWGTQVLGMNEAQTGVKVDTHAGELRARWCIGADGMASQVRRWAGLNTGRDASKRIGLRVHYRAAPWSELMEVHWGRTGQAYVTPTGTDEVSIAVLGRERYGSVAHAMEEFPQLKARLIGASRTSAERGAVTWQRSLPAVVTGRVALVGDASGSVDAISGAGLGLAFEQALALAAAISRGDLRPYEEAHRAIRRRATLVAGGLLLLDRSPALRRVALRSFRRKPVLFEQMLAIHSGAAPLAYLGSGGALTLGLQVLLG